jgi:hypothetical protein
VADVGRTRARDEDPDAVPSCERREAPLSLYPNSMWPWSRKKGEGGRIPGPPKFMMTGRA